MQERNGAALGRVRLFGQAQSNEAYQIRDLLTRSVVAFDWIELGSDEDCRRELGLALTDVRLPVVELPDGSMMSAPSLRELADRLGWVTQPKLRDLRRGARGTVGCRLRGFGRLARRHHRAPRGRGPGGLVEHDRELHGLPARDSGG